MSLIFANPAFAASNNSSLEIKKYTVNAEVMKNGEMAVNENVTFDFSGKFNGITKEIVFSKSSGISDLTVSQIQGDSEVPYMAVDSAMNGDREVYTIDKSKKDSWMLKIFCPSEDETKAFRISYVLHDAAVKYNDTAELNWNFIGKENKTPIRNVRIDIKVPEGIKKGEIKVFAHGPLNGNSSIIDDRTAELTVERLPSKKNIEARVLFPASLIPECKNIVNENKLAEILNQEKAFADKANKERATARLILKIVSAAAIALFFMTAFLAYYLHIKYNKEPESEFKGKYYRELPEDCSPAVMSVLYNFGNITTRDITATLMDLVRKKYLKIEIEKKEVKKLFGTKTKEDYSIVKLKDADNNLLEHERYFLNWMLNDIGDGSRLTFKNIERCTKSKTAALKFKGSYEAWADIVKMEAEDKIFFDRTIGKGKVIGSIFALLDIAAGVIFIILGGIAGIMDIIAGILLMIFSLTFKRRTKYGATQFAMWNAFKRFLREFSNLKEAIIPSLIIWEQYLVYAISLGVAREVIKQLKVIIPEEDYQANGLTYLYMGNYMYNRSVFERFDDISSQFEHASNSAFSLANSSDSSHSGGGGGFSSGSSGGGGGGGFGGF